MQWNIRIIPQNIPQNWRKSQTRNARNPSERVLSRRSVLYGYKIVDRRYVIEERQTRIEKQKNQKKKPAFKAGEKNG